MPDGRIWDQDAFVSVCFRPKADIRKTPPTMGGVYLLACAVELLFLEQRACAPIKPA